MAETVLGMATTLVGSALRVASTVAREEMGMLIGVHDDIWFITTELKMMQAFLRGVGGAHEKVWVLKAYLELIRDLAYDIEDCLEEFVVFIKRRSLMQQLINLGDQRRIAIQIRTIKRRVQELSQMNLRYNLITTPTISSDATDDVEQTRHLSALYVEEAQLVGLERPKAELMELINKQAEGLKVVSVVGMGGLGKTTLVKNIYDSTQFDGQFDNQAWIIVSQSFNKKELLKDLIKQLLGAKSLNNLLEQHQQTELQVKNFIDHLRKNLEKRKYLVVLDDLWTIEAWNCLKLALPEHSESSCVVITTRNGELAQECSPPTLIHKPTTLKEEDATMLLLRKTKRSHQDLNNNKHMKEIFGKILKKCGGLPLAIMTIGGLLANKDVKDWKDLHDQLPSELASNPSLKELRQVVTLSYNNLPSYLKPCFLYLSIFLEDFEIKRKRLVTRWIAEGFIRSGTSRRTVEEVAENYFYELIDRSMIHPSKLDINGNVKSCRVHDIIHDIAVSISRQENLVLLIEDHTSGTSATKESIRHLSVFARKKLPADLDLGRVRSLTLFNDYVEAPTLCLYQMTMLRVLDLEDSRFIFVRQHISHIGLLCHLKYLSIERGSYIYALPRSIGNLQDLQTLDMRNTYIVTLPTEITKLKNLRTLRCSKAGDSYDSDLYLCPPLLCLVNIVCLPFIDDCTRQIGELHMNCFSCCSDTAGVKFPKGISNLKELQILEVVDLGLTSIKAIEELGELTQLKELKVVEKNASMKKCKRFGMALEKLSSLRSLIVHSKSSIGTLNSLVFISSPLPYLRKLKLKGQLQKIPDWVGNSMNLMKIELEFSELKGGDALKSLEELPSLMRLRLYSSAYIGEDLVFRGKAFPELRVLELSDMWELSKVTFEKDTSPKMERIRIENCKLKSGIHGITHLPKLKEITLDSYGKVAKLDMLQSEVDAQPNRPVLRMMDDRRYHDLGEFEESDGMVQVTKVVSDTAESSECRPGSDALENAPTPELK